MSFVESIGCTHIEIGAYLLAPGAVQCVCPAEAGPSRVVEPPGLGTGDGPCAAHSRGL